MTLKGKRVLVTGGTGFIGGRLVERLYLEYGAKVRVLVRNYAKAARIARYEIEMAPGDLENQAEVAQAVEGCDYVFHCAYGSLGGAEKQRAVTVDGTRYLLDAAMAAGVSRFVHISTISVYGDLPDGVVDEKSPRQFSDNLYADTKLEAENLALAYHAKHGLPVTVLQPTVVYGPYGPAWTSRIVNELKTGRVILVNGGEGLCNLVYVDDVVEAMLQAAVKDAAVGETFLVSGSAPVSWKEFYGCYEDMLGYRSTVAMPAAEAKRLFNERYVEKKGFAREFIGIFRENKQLRWRLEGTKELSGALRIGKKLVPDSLRSSMRRRLGMENAVPGQPAQPASGGNGKKTLKPLHLLHPSSVDFQASKAVVSIEKARSLLGYEPQYDLNRGMAATEAWVRWANLLED